MLNICPNSFFTFDFELSWHNFFKYYLKVGWDHPRDCVVPSILWKCTVGKKIQERNFPNFEASRCVQLSLP